ncbi:Retrovirus-related Pol polyprotein from transposon TNT 1-94-like protein [Drosera capensis]
MDVKTVFLNGELEEKIYMAQPLDFKASESQHNKVCHLRLFIYGLKQCSRQCYLRFHPAILEVKFMIVEEDHYVYVKHFKLRGEFRLRGYADADWAVYRDERKPR